LKWERVVCLPQDIHEMGAGGTPTMSYDEMGAGGTPTTSYDEIGAGGTPTTRN